MITNSRLVGDGVDVDVGGICWVGSGTLPARTLRAASVDFLHPHRIRISITISITIIRYPTRLPASQLERNFPLSIQLDAQSPQFPFSATLRQGETLFWTNHGVALAATHTLWKP